MFSAAFSAAFRRGYIGPMAAQQALMLGAGAVLSGAALLVDRRVLIGPAGKIYAFASAESAQKWASHTAAAGLRQQIVIDGLSAPERAEWVAKKRAKLETVAARLVKAAAKQSDQGKQAALIAESDYCLDKWA